MRATFRTFLFAVGAALCLVRCGARSDILETSSGQSGSPDGSIHADASARPESGVDAPADADAAADAFVACDAMLDAPRPVAPLSTSTVTSHRPVLRWALASGADGAEVEVCRDRACAHRVATFDAAGTSAPVPVALTPGTYYWRLHGTVGKEVVTPSSPTWQFAVGVGDAPVAAAWGTVLDVNGDGFADVAVGAWGAQKYVGSVYVYLGGPQGLATTPSTTLTGPDGPGYFGASVASAGDVNGDGFADLVVGAYDVTDYSGVGAVYLYLGGSGGLSSAPFSAIAGSDGPKSQFGTSVASAGDVDGDGYGDVVVGSWAGAATLQSAAHAQVFRGGPCGLSPSGVIGLTGPAAHAEQRAIAVASAGDVDGDGYGDVLVGANGTDNSPREAYLYRGGSTGLSKSPDAILVSPGPPGGTSGAVAGAGDVNGDGYADVVLGVDSLGASDGYAYVYLGGAGGLSTAAATTLTEPSGDGGAFGLSVAGAGDVNADGYADVLVGGGGHAYVFPGGPAGVATVPIAVLTSSDPTGGDFGNSVAGVGDLDGDGFADVVVGAAGENGGAGSAYAFPGRAGGLSTKPATSLSGVDGVLGEFGASVACRDVARARAGG